MTVEVLAPAKVNLALHVTGQREDGHHLLDTLVGFGPSFDRLTLREGKTLSLTVKGPELVGVPSNIDNLVMKAARLLDAERGASMVLEKHLPAASGIGGGSSDAAAAIRGLLAMWERANLNEMSDRALGAISEKILSLGADVPMCLIPCPLRARGIGEKIEWVRGLPPLPVVLMNPRVPVSTADVFRGLRVKDNAPMPDKFPEWSGIVDFCRWLGEQRNDLQPSAMALCPDIGTTLDRLNACDGVLLTRMSGSGATCFAIFSDEEHCRMAADRLSHENPGYWVAGGWLGNKVASAMPKIS